MIQVPARASVLVMHVSVNFRKGIDITSFTSCRPEVREDRPWEVVLDNLGRRFTDGTVDWRLGSLKPRERRGAGGGPP